MLAKSFKQLRCPNCNKLIVEEAVVEGSIRFKCNGCKEFTTINYMHISRIGGKSKDGIIIGTKPNTQ